MKFRKSFILITSILSHTLFGSLYAQSIDSLKKPTDSLSLISKDTAAAKITDSLAASLLADSAAKVAAAGYVITGKIADISTGEGVPFATVFFPHSPVGTAADVDGNFEIKVDVLPSDTISAQAMGYKKVSHKLPADQKNIHLAIDLDRSSNMLGEVVIHAGEDPALLLLKQIIKHKPDNNPKRIENYRCEVYNKLEVDLQKLTREQFEKIPMLKHYSFIFNNLDTVSESTPYLPVFLTESLSDFYYQDKPRRKKEIIKATLVKGIEDDAITRFIGDSYQNINVYDNYVTIFNKQFVSPISNAGAFYYNYKIRDTQEVYGHKIILVQYSPKRQGESCFFGDFWVVDSLFAIQKVNMDIPNTANINYVHRVSLYQEFKPIDDSVWFCIKNKFIIDFDLPFKGKLPSLIGRKTATYGNIVIGDTTINELSKDKKYKKDVVVEYATHKNDEDYINRHRLDSLNKNEKTIYKMVDTITQMPITKYYKNTIKFLVTGVKDVGPLELGPYFYLYSRNKVEGNRVRITIGTPEKLKNMHFSTYLAYSEHRDSISQSHFKYGGEGFWIINRLPRTTLLAAYTHDLDIAANYYEQTTADNIFSSFFRKKDINRKFAFADETRIEFFRENLTGFSLKTTLHHKEFTPYAPLPYVGIFHDQYGHPTHSVINTEFNFQFRYAYKEQFIEGRLRRLSTGSKYPIVTIDAGGGVKGIWNGSYDYQRVRLALSDRLNIAPVGYIKYNIYAGQNFGTLPYPLLEVHPGNEYRYYNPNAFQMMNKYEFISDKYVGFYFEHNIGGGIFTYIPVVRKAKLRQFYTVRAIAGSLSEANKQLNLEPASHSPNPFRTLEGKPYVELGTGISNILELFRIDLVWRVTPKALQPIGVSQKPPASFGIFGSIVITF